jgi:hypothetical protein
MPVGIVTAIGAVLPAPGVGTIVAVLALLLINTNAAAPVNNAAPTRLNRPA